MLTHISSVPHPCDVFLSYGWETSNAGSPIHAGHTRAMEMLPGHDLNTWLSDGSMQCDWRSRGGCLVRDINNAAPYTIRLKTPDGYASHVKSYQHSFPVWNRQLVHTRHVGHLSVRGKDWLLRYPMDFKARNLLTVGYVFANRRFALVNRLAGFENLRIVGPI